MCQDFSMKVDIHYCQPWGYKDRAFRVKAQLEAQGFADFDLIPGRPGQFDIEIDGQIVLSRNELGRFPTDEEVLSLVGPINS